MNKYAHKALSYEINLFHIFIFCLIIFIKIINIQSKEYCKIITYSNHNYYIITQNKILFYNNAMKTTNEILTFVNDQIITQSEDLKMISSATFNSLINIILIKYYIYILSDEGMCYFNKKLMK